MDGIDYTKSLAKARTDFNQKLDSIREVHSHELNEKERTSSERESSLKDNYRSNIKDLEKAFNRTSSEANDRMSEVINEKTNEYRNGLRRNKEDFISKNKDQRRRLQNELDEVNRSYNKITKNREDSQDEFIGESKNKYKSRLKSISNKYHDNLTETQRSAEKDLSEYRVEQAAEKRKIYHDNNENIESLNKQSSNDRKKLNDQKRDQIGRLTDSFNGEKRALEEQSIEGRKELQAAQENEKDLMRKSFDNILEDLSTNAEIDRNRESVASERRYRSRENELNDEIFSLNRELNEKVKGGTKAEILAKDNTKLKSNFETRLRRVNNDNEKYRYRMQIEKERSDSQSLADLNHQQKNFHKIIDRKGSDFREFRTKKLSEIGAEHKAEVEKYRNLLKQTEMKADQKSITDKQKYTQELRKQKQRANIEAEDLAAKNTKMFDEIKVSLRKENVKTKLDAEQDNKNSLDELRSRLNKKVTNTEKSLTQRLEHQKEINFKITNQYEDKLTNLEKKYKKLVENLVIDGTQRTKQDKASFKREAESMKNNFEREKLKIKEVFEKRLSKEKTSSDLKLSKLIESHTEELSNERRDMQVAMKSKDVKARNRYEKLYEDSKLELEEVKHQYEIKISEMRDANRAAIEQMARDRKAELKKA